MTDERAHVGIYARGFLSLVMNYGAIDGCSLSLSLGLYRVS